MQKIWIMGCDCVLLIRSKLGRLQHNSKLARKQLHHDSENANAQQIVTWNITNMLHQNLGEAQKPTNLVSNRRIASICQKRFILQGKLKTWVVATSVLQLCKKGKHNNYYRLQWYSFSRSSLNFALICSLFILRAAVTKPDSGVHGSNSNLIFEGISNLSSFAAFATCRQRMF